MPSGQQEPICGAARTLSPGNVAVCVRYPSEHAALDHFDPQHGVAWPVCDDYCGKHGGSTGHICGRYRGDTAARYADA